MVRWLSLHEIITLFIVHKGGHIKCFYNVHLMNTMLNFLGDVLYDFCKLNSLEVMSADDLLYTPNLTQSQRDWLNNYIEVWDIIVTQED